MLKGDYSRRILDNISCGVCCVSTSRKILYFNNALAKLAIVDARRVLNHRCTGAPPHYIDGNGAKLCSPERCLMLDMVKHGHTRERAVHLQRQDGYCLPVSLSVTPLRNRNKKIIGAVGITRIDMNRMAGIKSDRELHDMAYLDPLTEVGNRRYIEMYLNTRLQELQKQKMPFGVFFIDIDHFKKFNDTYGHQCGDRVLKTVAGTLCSSLRPYDFLGRWGGEEFIAIVFNVPENMLYPIAERLRGAVEKTVFPVGQESAPLTVSIGAVLGERADTVHSLIKTADRLMYSGKLKGRNCVLTGKPMGYLGN